jgi:hypothetical protein
MFGETFGETFIARTAACLMIAATLAAAATSSADADPGDNGAAFLRHLGEDGIVPANPDAMVQLGNDICTEFASGEAYPDVLAQTRQSPAAAGASANALALVVQTAVFIICPQAADQLPR